MAEMSTEQLNALVEGNVDRKAILHSIPKLVEWLRMITNSSNIEKTLMRSSVDDRKWLIRNAIPAFGRKVGMSVTFEIKD